MNEYLVIDSKALRGAGFDLQPPSPRGLDCFNTAVLVKFEFVWEGGADCGPDHCWASCGRDHRVCCSQDMV